MQGTVGLARLSLWVWSDRWRAVAALSRRIG